MIIETEFVQFWHEISFMSSTTIPLGLAWRAWSVTRNVGEARVILGPTLRSQPVYNGDLVTPGSGVNPQT